MHSVIYNTHLININGQHYLEVIFGALLALQPQHAWTELWITPPYNSNGYPVGYIIGASPGFDGEGEDWVLWSSFTVPAMYLCNFAANFVIRVVDKSCRTCRGMPMRGGNQGNTIPDVPGTINLNFISVSSMAQASPLASS
jgi:hypothetical protein